MTSVTVITPSIGRPSLKSMLNRLKPQLEEGDEVFVIGDGPQPSDKATVEEIGHPAVRYSEIPLTRNYGNPQRNLAIEQANGDYLFFIDDDDLPSPHALSVIRKAAKEVPGRPFMFKMMHKTMELWREPLVKIGQVSGQMFVAPNVKERLGRWSGRYEADFDFITGTLALYPDKTSAIVWRNENICIQGYQGRQEGAVEIFKD
jgi:glycosyltransferase involved in cell wall biosynthesis